MTFQKSIWIGCVAILLFSLPVQAGPVEEASRRFGFGGKIGLNVATYGGDDADREGVESTNTLGVSISAFAVIHIHSLIAVQPDVMFTTKGSDALVDGVYGGGFNLSYIEIPLMARVGVPVRGQIKPYFLAGPQLSILVGSEIEEDDGRTADARDDTQSLDIGLILGAGAALAVPSLRGAVLVEARYDWGLRKVYPDGPLDLQTRTLSFLIGYQY